MEKNDNKFKNTKNQLQQFQLMVKCCKGNGDNFILGLCLSTNALKYKSIGNLYKDMKRNIEKNKKIVYSIIFQQLLG